LGGFFLLNRVFSYAKRTRGAIFAKSTDIKAHIAAKSSGLNEQGWYGTILDLSKEYGLETVKKMNVWDFLDIVNRQATLNIYQNELMKK